MDLLTYQQLKGPILKLIGINLDPYKDEQMRRRLDSWLSRSGEKTWDAYFPKIKSDANELKRFRDFITINVTEFFRDPERWKYLRENILPGLIQTARQQSDQQGLKIWSAGCSTGAEPYTLSLLLQEMAPTLLCQIIGTDLDRGALEKAKAGGPYLSEEIRNISPVQRSTYFRAGGPPFFIDESLAKRISFKELDLIYGKFENNHDLIVCRNVVIYFTGETKQHLYKKFHDALRPGGVLFVGGTEIIPRPQDLGFRSTGFSFYIKS